MRISDWSSDVCSSDLAALDGPIGAASVIKQYVNAYRLFFAWLGDDALNVAGVSDLRAVHIDGFASALEQRGMGAIHRHITVGKIINTLREIGRASCRERVCQYV